MDLAVDDDHWRFLFRNVAKCSRKAHRNATLKLPERGGGDENFDPEPLGRGKECERRGGGDCCTEPPHQHHDRSKALKNGETRIFAGAGSALPKAISPGHCERAGFDSRVLRITVDPNRPDDIYAALEVSGVIRSTDGGETWSDMSAPLIKLAEQPHLQSSVGGRHCGHCEGMLDSHATAISPAAPDTVFLGLRMGLFRSDDRGATWYDTEIEHFSPLTYCHDVVVSPHDPRVVFTCLSPAAFSNDGSLYRSDDLAQSWRRIDHGIKADSTLMAVSLHPSDPAQVFCVTRGGQVFGTEDSGGSWQEYRLPSGVEDVYAVACR
jgi:hypothetical protein